MRFFRANPDCSSRFHEEEEHNYRNAFSRDRDRILYSKEFRRLSGKTQVFVVGFYDHARTRLTHTLEVAQISKTIAAKLGLDENLCESISFGHDVGHTPFGHVGERTLNLLMNGCDKYKGLNKELPENQKGFKHNWQGLRVTIDLEKYSPSYRGLNLTDYTLWGILNHSNLEYKKCDHKVGEKCKLRHIDDKCDRSENSPFSIGFYLHYHDLYLKTESWTVEAGIVKWADEIAQRHHDIEDGLLAGIIDKDELLNKFSDVFETYLSKDEQSKIKHLSSNNSDPYFIHSFSRLLINFYVTNFIDDLQGQLRAVKNEYGIDSTKAFQDTKTLISQKNDIYKLISFEKEFIDSDKVFQNYLRERILNSHLAQIMDGKADYIIRQSIKAYLSNPQQLNDQTIVSLYRNWKTDNFEEMNIGSFRQELRRDHSTGDQTYKNALLRTVCDFVAGMTDQYALKKYEQLYGPGNIERYI